MIIEIKSISPNLRVNIIAEMSLMAGDIQAINLLQVYPELDIPESLKSTN